MAGSPRRCGHPRSPTDGQTVTADVHAGTGLVPGLRKWRGSSRLVSGSRFSGWVRAQIGLDLQEDSGRWFPTPALLVVEGPLVHPEGLGQGSLGDPESLAVASEALPKGRRFWPRVVAEEGNQPRQELESGLSSPMLLIGNARCVRPKGDG